MKAIPVGLIIAGLVVLVRAVRADFPFPWGAMFPLCGGGPPSLYDVAAAAVLLITARAFRIVRRHRG